MAIDLNELYKDLPTKEENVKVADVSQWADEWYNSILPENNQLTLGFEKFDKEMKNKLRSKLLLLIGYGGTKKSLLSQNICFRNIENNNSRILYSSMEMGAVNLINRLIDMKCDGEKYNAHNELEYHNNITKQIDAKKFYNTDFAPAFKDKFFITENTSLLTENYDKLLYKLQQEMKPIDILVVDGLAGMGGSGTETELYSKHSKELKALANKWKILVILICHTSKGGKKTDRDLSNLIRSSEKIIDNCDFHITTSLFADLNDKDQFDQQYGALRLINKRGSGNTIDQVYEFNGKKLLMNDTDLEFKQWNNDF